MIHLIISISIITMLTGCIRLTFVDQPPVSKQTEITEEEKTEIEKMVEDVDNGELNYSVSISNHRVNSVFTSMKRELRYFLKSDGKSMVEVDIKTSHPYTLATILTKEFFTQTSEDYNLYSMYPQVHRYFKHSCESMEYQDYVKKFVRYMIVESNVINDKYIEYYTYKGDVLTNIKNHLIDTFVSYMCGRFWRRAGIQKYRSLNFQNESVS